LSHFHREQSRVTLVDNSGQWWLTLAHWWWVIKVIRLQSLMTQHGLLQPYDEWCFILYQLVSSTSWPRLH
jgi:hypothetical protein